MRLKKIEICGFKSFADRTVVHFDAGITCIVGPNGCGKSNVSDAFRWVLGEQSPKSMRGEKMGDVIFAGTGRRKGSPYAEVVLTFTEVGDALPIDYEEVSVGRRLYKSGESEYRLNGNIVRLRDIHSLFWDTGLGKDSLAIFEQGKIEEVIVRSPLDRRPIFESAAGILRFRIRRKETKAKLEKMDGNLSRVEDLLGEVNRQMQSLEKQVAEAKEYRKTKGELELLEKGVMHAKLVRAKENAQREAKRQEKLDERLKKAKERLFACDEALKKGQSAAGERESEFRGAQEKLFKKRGELDLVREKHRSLSQRIEEWEKELLSLAEQRKELVVEEIGDLEGRVKEAEKVYKASSKGAEQLEKAVHQSRSAQKRAEERRMEAVRAEHAVCAQLRELQVRLESGSEQLTQIEARSGESQAMCEQVKQQLTEQKRLVKSSVALVDKSKAKLSSLDDGLSQRRERLASLQKEIEQSKERLIECRASEKALQRLKEELSPGAKRLLEEVKGVSRLTEQMRPKRGMKSAFASFLQSYDETLWVSDQAKLKSVVEYAQANGICGYSVTCHEPRYDLVEQIDFKTKGSLTKEGEYLDGQGVFFGPPDPECSAVLREAEINALQEEMGKLEGRLRKDEAELAALGSEIERLEKERAECDRNHRQDEMKLVEVNFALQRAKGDLERLEGEVGKSKERHQQLTKGRTELARSIEKLEAKRATATTKLVEVQELCKEAEGSLEEKLEQLQSVRLDSQQCEKSYRQLAEELHQRRSAAKLVEAKLQAIERQEKKCERELKQAKSDLSKLASPTGDLSSEEERYRRAEERAAAAKERLDKGREQQRVAGEEVQRLTMERQQLEGRRAGADKGLKAATQEALERFELTPIQLQQMDLPKVESIGESERQVYQMRRRLESASNVNLGAVEEYEQYKERSDFLSSQVGDLQGSKKELLQIIGELEKTSRVQFRETFEKVRANFKRTFELLFEGGEADLKFTESNDILEAGIEIVAQPPGKAMRSISLLSGGEKCLTALALLFAIFEVNPSPVCILDETDAPLDDTNVTRFLRVLGSFLETTQFIMITHNKKTMEAAGVLIGVTMQEKGVSKPIAMRMSDVSEEMTVGV